jgi:hypothetical protein
MAIADVDLSGNTFTLTPMNMTDTAQTLLESIIANIGNDKVKFETLQTTSQNKFNEIAGVVNGLGSAHDLDVEELQNKIDAIIALESEAGNDSFVGLFSKLYTEINRRKEVLAWTLDVENTVEGKVGIDLTAYGFSSTNEYTIQAEVQTAGTQNLSCSIEYASATSAVLTIRDNQFIQFGTNANSFYTANATDKKVKVSIILVKTATPLFGTVTEVDGDVDEFGTPLVAPVEMVSSTVDADGNYVLNGLQGTLTPTVVTVVESDPYTDFTVNATDGTDEFTITSNTPVKINGNILVNKTVDGVSAPSRVFVYVSPFPQTLLSMITLDDDANIVFDGKVALANMKLNVSIDGTALAEITLDADGKGLTGEAADTINDEAEHTYVFTVTNADGLVSVERTKLMTLNVDNSGNAEI